ncbi:glycerophosphodiester phosphodiesterase [Phytoactinopolyspora limicola]|uniref:glycerophosphodiester phosphodiesterase n=1 Tax=Phytoactinopolyspora limicola TaxID=2715536 RepID=UPI00140CA843|nr:glycerophosphodiester phosphodiesterase [Phytoactinopolyspora limicola]
MTTNGDSHGGRGDRPLLTVAHRAGNVTDALRTALEAGVDLVEADVRYFKGVPEVRHAKTLGRQLLWEPGEVMNRHDTPVPTLAEVLDQLGPDRHRLMLDLKGVRLGLGPAVARVLQEHAAGVPVAISTPHWWMFKSFADLPDIRPILSAGSWPMVERLRGLIRKGPDAWPNQQSIFGCSVHRTLLSPAIVAELRRRVRHVITWPVDTQGDLDDALRLGVTGITSKNVSLLASLTTNGRT